MRFTERSLRAVEASRYREGQPLGEMREVAQRACGTVTEVPQWGCLLVRIPRDGALSYLVVENGSWLTADADDGLRAISADEFAFAYMAAKD